MIMCNVSSPQSAKDKIMRLVQDAQTNNKILAFHAPTWEANPDYTFEDLREEMSHVDIKDFMRDFGAEPPLSSDPFLSDPETVDRICRHEPIQIDIEFIRKEISQKEKYKSAVAHVHKPDKSTYRMMTLDLGWRKNALALVLFSLNGDGKIVVDFAVEMAPEPGYPINVAHFFDHFVVPIVKGYNIKYAFFDRWNSLDQMYRLKDYKVDAQLYSLKYQDMSAAKGLILAQNVLIPSMPKDMQSIAEAYLRDEKHVYLKNAYTNLGTQFLTVRDTGRQMLKPLDGDDDLFRAFCLGAHKMSDPKIRKVFEKGATRTTSGHQVRALGAVRMRYYGGQEGAVQGAQGADGKPLGIVKSRRRS
jgi:hypothetical protein